MQSLFAVFALASIGVFASNLLRIGFQNPDQKRDEDGQEWFDPEDEISEQVSPLERTLTLLVFGVACIVFTLLFFISSRQADEARLEQSHLEHAALSAQRAEQRSPPRSYWPDAAETKAYRDAGEIVYPSDKALPGSGNAVGTSQDGQMSVSRSTLRLEAARKSLATLSGVQNVYLRNVSPPAIVLGVGAAHDAANELALQACWTLEEHRVRGGVVYVVDDAKYRQGEWQHLATTWCQE